MTITFDQFEADALARGFDQVLERRWEPGQVVDEHRHPFAADALVVEGEMWLTEATGTRHLLAGDRFALAPDVPHSERYGATGATYWVARRDQRDRPATSSSPSAAAATATGRASRSR